MARLEGKIALVTGAGRGIDEGIARMFTAEGASVLLADRDAEAVERVTDSLRAEGGTAEAFVADVAVTEDVRQIVAAAVDRFSGLNILGNNAALTGFGRSMEAEDLEARYDLLGGLTRDYIKCYGTDIVPGSGLRENARACMEAGFRVFRCAVADRGSGVFDARRAVEQSVKEAEEVRAGVGDDGDWAIDFHTRLDLADSVRLCTLLEPLASIFVEDPCARKIPARWPRCARRCAYHLPSANSSAIGGT